MKILYIILVICISSFGNLCFSQGSIEYTAFLKQNKQAFKTITIFSDSTFRIDELCCDMLSTWIGTYEMTEDTLILTHRYLNNKQEIFLIDNAYLYQLDVSGNRIKRSRVEGKLERIGPFYRSQYRFEIVRTK